MTALMSPYCKIPCASLNMKYIGEEYRSQKTSLNIQLMSNIKMKRKRADRCIWEGCISIGGLIDIQGVFPKAKEGKVMIWSTLAIPSILRARLHSLIHCPGKTGLSVPNL